MSGTPAASRRASAARMSVTANARWCRPSPRLARNFTRPSLPAMGDTSSTAAAPSGRSTNAASVFCASTHSRWATASPSRLDHNAPASSILLTQTPTWSIPRTRPSSSMLADLAERARADERPHVLGRRYRLLAVVEEAEAGLLAEVALLREAAEERRRTVADVVELGEQQLGHGVDDVQADEVAQGERADRMAAAEAHGGVDLVGPGQPLLVGGDGADEIRHEQAVHDEPGRVHHRDDGLAQAGEEARRGGKAFAGGAGEVHQLDELHRRDRREEVHADRPVRARARHLGDAQRRRVRGEDRARPDDGDELGEQRLLGGEVLDDALDDEIDA